MPLEPPPGRPGEGRARAYPAVRHVLQVIEVVLLDRVGLPGHLEHAGRAQLVLHRNGEVVGKHLAVDGGRHQDDLQRGRDRSQGVRRVRTGGGPLGTAHAFLLLQELLRL